MKFCGTCGAPVSADEAAGSKVDPFAQTKQKRDDDAPPSPPAPPPPPSSASGVSPLAVSNIQVNASGPNPPSVSPSSPARPISKATPLLQHPFTRPMPSHRGGASNVSPTPGNVHNAASLAPTAAQPAVSPFVPQMRVLVLWSDGNRYPGVVTHVNDRLCLVSFGDGQQRWVDMQYLTRA